MNLNDTLSLPFKATYIQTHKFNHSNDICSKGFLFGLFITSPFITP